MSARFKFGDIIENGWAGEGNPRKRGVYLWSVYRTGKMNPGKHVKLMHDDGTTSELLISDDDKMTVVGTIFDAKLSDALAAKDAEIAKLREENARLREAMNQIAEMANWQIGVPTDTEAANEHARIAHTMAETARASALAKEPTP